MRYGNKTDEPRCTIVECVCEECINPQIHHVKQQGSQCGNDVSPDEAIKVVKCQDY